MGNNNVFALGDDGRIASSNEYFVFPEDRYLDVATSGVGACAVREEGPIRCVRVDDPPEALEARYVRVALEYFGRVCAIRQEDAAIACWSIDVSAPFTPPAGQFTQIAATSNGMCAVRTDGSIVCFGDTDLPVPAGW